MYLGIGGLVVLESGDIVIGDMGGSIRGYTQSREPVDSVGRPCGGPPARAHGTVSITRPKDPTMPLLTQVNQNFIHLFADCNK